MIEALNRLLSPMANRIANMVARAIVRRVNDGQGMQLMQLSILDGETRDEIERIQQYGFTSVPYAGAEVVAVFAGGRRDHGLAIAVDDRRYRKSGLEEGEVALYHKDGASIVLKTDGSIELTPKSGQHIILNGGSTQVALADHTHGPGSFNVPGEGAVVGTSDVSSSNTTGVKAA